MQNRGKRGKFGRVIVQEFERRRAFENCCGRGGPRSGLWAQDAPPLEKGRRLGLTCVVSCDYIGM
jgi:hypothetical protein